MKIISMTATFGKLENETLELGHRLNVRSAPNEWGKSTWCAFLAAMLYGIDTRERSTRDQLADKERYMPWSGRPMAGVLRVLHEGRDITIQRRTTNRVPLGEFSAYETMTGVPVRELTAENCGQVLLGVEKSVFLRTGFLRFSDLPVRQDENLRRRLNSLVTTGDESGGAELLGEKLRELKNQCRHNSSGLIPECRNEIRLLQEQLWERQALQKQHDALDDQIRRKEAELEQLELHRRWLAYYDAEAHAARVKEASDATRTADRLVQTLTEKYADIPAEVVLNDRVARGQSRLQEIIVEPEPPGSPLPIVLSAVMAALLLIAAVLMADHGLLVPCIVLFIVMLITTLVLISRRRQEQMWYNIRQARRKAKEEELEKSISAWEGQIRTYSDLEKARRNAQDTRRHLDALDAMTRNVDQPAEPDPLDLTREETICAIADLMPELNRGRLQLGQFRGRMEHLSDPEQLQHKLHRVRCRLSELEKTYQAIELAQAALESASMELQRRFAPEITRLAGHYLHRLTGGVYDRIVIGEDLSVQAARSDEITLRSPQWRSEGTGDQMYLALRLAVWEVLAPECPIILDDALIRFDQTRMERAMELLKELSADRQILLFSCQEREKEYMQRANAAPF